MCSFRRTTRAADGTLLYANRQFGALLGIQVEQAIGRTFDHVVAEPSAYAAILAALAGDTDVRPVEISARRPDRTVVRLMASSSRVVHEDEPDAVLSAFCDVTDRAHLETKPDELIGLLLNSTAEGIYGIDLNGNCTFANRACLKLLGFEGASEILGRNMHELVHHTHANGDPYPVQECRIYRAFREREGTHVDDEVMWRSDGSRFPVEYWSYPVECDGELMGCVVTFVDISERRRAERLLAEQSAALAEVARFPEMNPGPVLRLELDGTVVLANAAARHVFGGEIVGRCWRDVCPSVDETMWREILAAKARTS